MASRTFIRISDGLFVNSSEACWNTGALRPGYRFDSGQVADGEIVDFRLALMDAAPGRQPEPAASLASLGDAATHLTDAERSFADSPQGRETVALARSTFNMGEAYKPASECQPWTDQMASAVVRDAAASLARHRAGAGIQDAATAAYAVLENDALVQADRALNDWRSEQGR